MIILTTITENRPLFPKTGIMFTSLLWRAAVKQLSTSMSRKLLKHIFSDLKHSSRNVTCLLPVVQAQSGQTLQMCLVKTAFINYANKYFPQEKSKSLIICRIITIPLRNQELVTMRPNQAYVAHKHSVESKQFSHADYGNTIRVWSQNTINHVHMVWLCLFFLFPYEGLIWEEKLINCVSLSLHRSATLRTPNSDIDEIVELNNQNQHWWKAFLNYTPQMWL